MIESFSVSNFGIFSSEVTLDFAAQQKNTSFMDDVFLTKEDVSRHKVKVGKVIALYGNNNSGKSCLLEAFACFAKIVKEGNLIGYPFPLLKNYFLPNTIPTVFALSFLSDQTKYRFQISFVNGDAISESLSKDDGDVLYERNEDGSLKGIFFETNDSFKRDVSTLMKNRLILNYYTTFKNEKGQISDILNPIRAMMERIIFVNGLSIKSSTDRIIRFYSNPKKCEILNTLVKDSSFFVEQRKLVSQEEVLHNEKVRDLIGLYLRGKTPSDDDVMASLDQFRLMSFYEGPDHRQIMVPSSISDSTGTKKFFLLAMDIIDALFMKAPLMVIDEFDASLHYRLLEKLIALMQSSVNSGTQFLIITQEVELLDPTIFRKDQISFMNRTSDKVSVIRLSSFLTNDGNVKIRKTTDVAGTYRRNKIVPIPDSSFDSSVIKDIVNRFEDGEDEQNLDESNVDDFFTRY